MSATLVALMVGWLVAGADLPPPHHAQALQAPQAFRLASPEKVILQSMWGAQVPRASQLDPAWRLTTPETPVLYEGRGRACSGAEHDMAWNSQYGKLQWLRIRLGLMDSLEPQRCTVSARICITDC